MLSVLKCSLVWLVFLSGFTGFLFGETEFSKESNLGAENSAEVQSPTLVYVIPVNEAIISQIYSFCAEA